jgi:hypothetical protein
VKHVFRFSLRRSLANAVKKARYWTMYSLANRDIFADSGAASVELKTNVLVGLLQAFLVAASVASGEAWPLLPVLPLLAFDLAANRRLIGAWSRAAGWPFSVLATVYYLTLYAAAVGAGAAIGVVQYLWSIRLLRRYRSCTARFGT